MRRRWTARRRGRPAASATACPASSSTRSRRDFPGEIAAAASYYGAGIVTDRPDSPHLRTGDIAAELYLAFAEDDPWVPDPTVEALAQCLEGSAVRHRIERYAGAHHGFAFPDRHCYDKAAAERHWERMFALFRRNLG